MAHYLLVSLYDVHTTFRLTVNVNKSLGIPTVQRGVAPYYGAIAFSVECIGRSLFPVANLDPTAVYISFARPDGTPYLRHTQMVALDATHFVAELGSVTAFPEGAWQASLFVYRAAAGGFPKLQLRTAPFVAFHLQG